jgi:hypothetical protein
LPRQLLRISERSLNFGRLPLFQREIAFKLGCHRFQCGVGRVHRAETVTLRRMEQPSGVGNFLLFTTTPW